MWVLAGPEEGLSDRDRSLSLNFLQIWNFLVSETEERPCVTWVFKGKYLNSSVLSPILCAWQFSSLVLDGCHDLECLQLQLEVWLAGFCPVVGQSADRPTP